MRRRRPTQDAVPGEVLAVGEIVDRVRGLLETEFPALWIEGELSNFSRPRSGHWYFTLKDDRAQLRCAMFRGSNVRVRFEPRDGQLVQVLGRLSIYPDRGDFQLIAERMQPAGEGALRAAFEALKARLDAEGLTATERKRELPRWPRRVAVIASATSAALQDIRSVIGRRFPRMPTVELHAAVQGVEAVPELLAALNRASESGADVILLARGGGSLEDLWAFNDERLARAIVAAPVPVVTGIGHETDFTIADFVADLRAPTPSAAAETITPDAIAAARTFAMLRQQLARQFGAALQRRAQRLDTLTLRLQRAGPEARLARLRERLAHGLLKLRHAAHQQLQRQRARLDRARTQLQQRNAPDRILVRTRQRLDRLRDRIASAGAAISRDRRGRLGNALIHLDAVSPLATLGRGYAIVTRPDTSTRWGIAVDGPDVSVGTALAVRFRRGRVDVEVTGVDPEDTLGGDSLTAEPADRTDEPKGNPTHADDPD